MSGLRHLGLAGFLTLLTGCGVIGLAPAGAAPAVGRPGTGLHDLVRTPGPHGGQPVAVEGEVVGEMTLSGAEGRVTIHAGAAAVAVWAPAGIIRKIHHTGRKYIQGDRVRVAGTFHRSDPAHGGEPAILATDITLVEPGGMLRPEYGGVRTVLTAVAWFAGGTATGVWILRRKA